MCCWYTGGRLRRCALSPCRTEVRLAVVAAEQEGEAVEVLAQLHGAVGRIADEVLQDALRRAGSWLSQPVSIRLAGRQQWSPTTLVELGWSTPIKSV